MPFSSHCPPSEIASPSRQRGRPCGGGTRDRSGQGAGHPAIRMPAIGVAGRLIRALSILARPRIAVCSPETRIEVPRATVGFPSETARSAALNRSCPWAAERWPRGAEANSRNEGIKMRLPTLLVLSSGLLAGIANAQEAQPLRLRLNADIRSLDPGVNRDANTDAVQNHLFEGLVAFREDASV